MRVNRSVWWEEVDQALYDFIKENVFYKRGGKEIPVPIHFYPIKDERLIKSGLRPGVAIQHLVEKFDTDRYSSEEVVGRDIEKDRIVMKGSLPNDKETEKCLKETRKFYKKLRKLENDFNVRFNIPETIDEEDITNVFEICDLRRIRR